MTRFFIPADAIRGDRLLLRGGDAHHARRVLRLGPGDRLRAVLPDGAEAEVVLEEDRGGELVGRVVALHRPQREPRLRVHLAQALVKGEKFDWVVQKGTEVGVASFLPFAAARSVVRLEAERARSRVERWRRIAREAAEQCGRLVAPPVAEVAGLPDLLARVRGCPLALLAWEAEEGQGLYDALDARLGACVAPVAADPPVRELLLIVGPEGGFEQDEARALIGAGAVPVSLGPLIFRAETAGLAAAVMILYHAGDLGRAARVAPPTGA